MVSILVEVAGESDIGLVRRRNEDVCLIGDLSQNSYEHSKLHRLQIREVGLLLSVFDGMGGALAGDKASRMASEALLQEMSAQAYHKGHDLREPLARAIAAANHQIWMAGQQNPKCAGMGTTITSVALVDETMVVGHVGDSRAYLLRQGKLVQLTDDQSLYNKLLAAGKITREEAVHYEHVNVILQALGVCEDIEPFFAQVRLKDGDLLLLCTDGLTALVPDNDIQDVLQEQGSDLEAAAQRLLKLAREQGGHDNATAVLARFEVKGAPGDDSPADGQGRPSPVVVRPFESSTLKKWRLLRRARKAMLLLVLLLALIGTVVGGVLLLVLWGRGT